MCPARLSCQEPQSSSPFTARCRGRLQCRRRWRCPQGLPRRWGRRRMRRGARAAVECGAGHQGSGHGVGSSGSPCSPGHSRSRATTVPQLQPSARVRASSHFARSSLPAGSMTVLGRQVAAMSSMDFHVPTASAGEEGGAECRRLEDRRHLDRALGRACERGEEGGVCRHPSVHPEVAGSRDRCRPPPPRPGRHRGERPLEDGPHEMRACRSAGEAEERRSSAVVPPRYRARGARHVDHARRCPRP